MNNKDLDLDALSNMFKNNQVALAQKFMFSNKKQNGGEMNRMPEADGRMGVYAMKGMMGKKKKKKKAYMKSMADDMEKMAGKMKAKGIMPSRSNKYRQGGILYKKNS